MSIFIQIKREKNKRDYDFIEPDKTSGKNRKKRPHKYIATAVEAMIGAIYKEEGKLDIYVILFVSV